MADMEHIMGCLTVQLTAQGGMAVHLVPKGGITTKLFPVCAVDIGTTLPPNALLTVDGIPFVTSDGYYLIVATS